MCRASIWEIYSLPPPCTIQVRHGSMIFCSRFPCDTDKIVADGFCAEFWDLYRDEIATDDETHHTTSSVALLRLSKNDSDADILILL
jgi:hypothetical protein